MPVGSPARNKTGKDKGDPLQRFPGVVFLICKFTITRVVASASEAALRSGSLRRLLAPCT
jgi:hypothetical protein